jgi:hypothetical protein
MSRSSQWRRARLPVLLGGALLAIGWPGIAMSLTEPVAPPAAAVANEASLEGSVTSVSPSGESFTVGTTTFSFAEIPMDVLDSLTRGAFVRVRFSKEGSENVVTSIWVQRIGFGNTVLWSRPGTAMPRFGSSPGRPAGGS